MSTGETVIKRLCISGGLTGTVGDTFYIHKPYMVCAALTKGFSINNVFGIAGLMDLNYGDLMTIKRVIGDTLLYIDPEPLHIYINILNEVNSIVYRLFIIDVLELDESSLNVKYFIARSFIHTLNGCRESMFQSPLILNKMFT